ncbi:MAG: hypothetical protein ACRDPA_11710 [Solirubrobacteraceae bacterium]
MSIRVYERIAGGLLYRETRYAGRKDRKSLGHRDRKLAVEQARELARALAEQTYAGVLGPLTFGALIKLYLEHRAPQLSEQRRARTQIYLVHLRNHFGDDLLVEDLDQTRIDGFAAARRAGALRTQTGTGKRERVRDGTIRQNLNLLAAMLRWARGFRLHGHRLLLTSPLDGVKLPVEKNVRRPIASEDRFRRTLAKAESVDPTGRFVGPGAVHRQADQRHLRAARV